MGGVQFDADCGDQKVEHKSAVKVVAGCVDGCHSSTTCGVSLKMNG